MNNPGTEKIQNFIKGEILTGLKLLPEGWDKLENALNLVERSTIQF